MDFNKELLLSGNKLIYSQSGELREASVFERLKRFFSQKTANAQDQRVAEIFIDVLYRTQIEEKDFQPLLKVADNFVKTHLKSLDAIKRLSQVIFAKKCEIEIGIDLEHLIDQKGNAISHLLPFLRANHLHYVISKANQRDKDSSILFHEGKAYIRAKGGENFLNRPDRVDAILKRLSKDHPDYNKLSKIKRAFVDPRFDGIERMKLQREFRSGLYCYRQIQMIKTDDEGVMKTSAYLPDGIEEHDQRKWETLKPIFRKEGDGKYHLRIVTRLPDYSLSKTWWDFIRKVVPKLFTLRNHGHSWAEVVEPILDSSGRYTGQSNVYNLGYYFHVMDAEKKLLSADPMSYMPLSKESMVVDDHVLTKEKCEEAISIIEGTQQYFLGKITSNFTIPKNESEDLYFASFYNGTCLSFVSRLRTLVTGVVHDNRSLFRRTLIPRRLYPLLDLVETLLRATKMTRKTIRAARFLSRMEVPYYEGLALIR